MAQTGGTYSRHTHGGNCGVCGSVNAIYTLIFYHQKTNSYIHMGADCSDKVYMGADFGQNAFRRSCEDARLAHAGKRKAQAVLSDLGLSAAWDIYEAEYESLPRDPKTVRTEKTVEEFGQTTVVPAYAGELYYEERTIRDIVGKLIKYGSISPAASDLLRTLTQRIPGRDQRNAEYAAQRAAEKAAAKPAPTGRVKIEGTVLKVEDRESDWGTVTKMTVKSDDGWLCWATVPSGVTVEKDCRIVFVATLTPSEQDAKFAWAKRPVLYVSPEEKKARKAAQKAETHD